jgi:hypothetical protein
MHFAHMVHIRGLPAGEAPHKFTPPDTLGVFDMPVTDPALEGVHHSLNRTLDTAGYAGVMI